MAASIDNNLFTNSTVTTTGSTTFQNLQNTLDPYMELLIHVVNAPTGTSPTLTFSIAVSMDNINFDTIYTGTAISAAGWQRTIFNNDSATGVQLPIMEPWIKVTWTVGGTTPSFTGVYADLLFSNPNEG